MRADVEYLIARQYLQTTNGHKYYDYICTVTYSKTSNTSLIVKQQQYQDADNIMLCWNKDTMKWNR